MSDYCSQQDVEDMLPTGTIGSGTGKIEAATLLRVITKKSGYIDFLNNNTTFEETEVTEYYESYGLDSVILDKTPVVSITSLSVEETSGTWTAKVEGRTSSTDDFWLDKADAGIIRFHGNVTKGYFIKVVYKHGYTTIPDWLKDYCAKLVCIDLFKLKVFDEECNELFKYFLDELREYKKDIKKYEERINQRKIVAKSLGARYATRPVNEIQKLRAWNK